MSSCGLRGRFSLVGGAIYGMRKTTIYLPEELKRAVEAQAERHGISEAEVIRAAIRKGVEDGAPPPRPGIFSSDELLAERVDELLVGFGER